MIKAFRNISKVSGPLLEIKDVEGATYDELVEIVMTDGTVRTGQVIEIHEETALVEIFEGTAGIIPNSSKVRFMGKPFTLDVSEQMIGRIFDGLGRPIDNLPPIIAEKQLDINGIAMNPIARDYPDEFIQTGISSIDELNTLVRGQKLPIFSEAGLPHNELAAQIARQAKVIGGDNERFAVVFAALGITFEEAVAFFINDFQKTKAIDHSVLFLNLANNPAMERIATPKMALTAAEYLAFEKDMHVLVIMNDITNYCEALREVSAARREVPGATWLSSYLYTNLSLLYERAGRIAGKKGSITQIPILTMPEGDITHPIPDLTGYITEGQILLSRELNAKKISPPIDVLTSLSRLKDKGIGTGKTREDHADVMNQVFSAYAFGKNTRELAAVLGESALSDLDLKYAKFADEFEKKFLNQGFDGNRSIIESLEISWELLAILPKNELKRISEEFIGKYHPEGLGGIMGINPTRMELSRQKKKLKTAKDAYKLLKDKQDELVRKFIALIKETVELRNTVNETIAKFSAVAGIASAEFSDKMIKNVFLTKMPIISAEINEKNWMGLPVIDINYQIDELKPTSAFISNPYLSKTIRDMAELLPLLLKLTISEKNTAILAKEIQSLRRRVNSLEHMIIPEHESNIRMIKMKLSDSEREAITRLIKVKNFK